MIGLRSLITGYSRAKTMLCKVKTPTRLQKFSHHDDGPPQPFDNLPFSIPNSFYALQKPLAANHCNGLEIISLRYAATVVFSIFFGLGFWAPYVILWYSMAKRTL